MDQNASLFAELSEKAKMKVALVMDQPLENSYLKAIRIFQVEEKDPKEMKYLYEAERYFLLLKSKKD